jgi:hypothetical protein
MTTRRRTSTKKAQAVRATSWLALLAATTLGVDGAKTVRAEVKAEGDLADSRDYRLVVQSYDAHAGSVPRASERPVGSYQRAVTAAELRRGVHVSLVELRQNAAVDNAGSVVAWIEAGKPDLEFDGRTARPRPGSMFGLARRVSGDSSVHIRLTRRAAA